MTTLERIAQAAYESMVKRTVGDDSIMANEANPFLRGEWSAQTQELKNDWLTVARATVEALREPSAAMKKAAWDYQTGKVWIGKYQEIIDAILNEKADG